MGAWFAAIAAGYAADRFIAAAPAGRQQAFTSATCVIALVFPVYLGAVQSWSFATSWPNAKAFIAVFRPLADHSRGPMLVEDPSIAKYYLPAGRHWQRWSSTRTIILPSGAITGDPAAAAGAAAPGNASIFARYIAQGYFSYVALNFTDTSALDHGLATCCTTTRTTTPSRSSPTAPSPAVRPGHLRDLEIRAAVMIDQRTASTGTMARPPADGQRHGLVPPHPPGDDEKHLYVQRNLPYLATVIFIGSFCLI